MTPKGHFEINRPLVGNYSLLGSHEVKQWKQASPVPIFLSIITTWIGAKQELLARYISAQDQRSFGRTVKSNCMVLTWFLERHLWIPSWEWRDCHVLQKHPIVFFGNFWRMNSEVWHLSIKRAARTGSVQNYCESRISSYSHLSNKEAASLIDFLVFAPPPC